MAVLPLAEVRELLSRLTAREDEMASRQVPTMFREDPAWLRLPPAKRDVALTRLEVLSAFEAKRSPTKAEAIAAASKLNVQLRTFYAMLRDWRDKGRSPFALVPYRGGDAAASRSRLDVAVAEKLTEIIRALLIVDASIRPGEAVRAVASVWPNELKRPSDVTVRNHVERLKAERPPSPGSFKLTLGNRSRAEAVRSTRFGEVIVIDHTSTARLLILGDAATSPTVTLALDLWSGAPVGAAVSGGEPGPEGLLDALADAQARLDGFGGDAGQPRIVYASADAPEWDALRDALLTAGVEVDEHRDHRLHCGDPIRRLVGGRLDDIQLQSLRTRHPEIDHVDPSEDALLTIRELRFVIDTAVDRLVERRVKPAAGRDGGKLVLPEWITLRGSLKARCVPLIELPRDDRAGEREAGGASDAAVGAPDPIGAMEDELGALVRKVAGASLMGVEIRAPDLASPGWVGTVTVKDAREVPALWLRLAREAVRMADLQGQTVRFVVDAVADGDPPRAEV